MVFNGREVEMEGKLVWPTGAASLRVEAGLWKGEVRAARGLLAGERRESELKEGNRKIQRKVRADPGEERESEGKKLWG